jgi:hypothetical protein
MFLAMQGMMRLDKNRWLVARSGTTVWIPCPIRRVNPEGVPTQQEAETVDTFELIVIKKERAGEAKMEQPARVPGLNK